MTTNRSVIRIATHDGKYHQDDVLAVAMLTTIFPSHQVIRSRDADVLDMADYLVDVGGVYNHTERKYDHHMKNPPIDVHDNVLSSAGLIWRHYGKAYIRAIGIPRHFVYKGRTIDLISEVEKIIKVRWIIPIDRNDNGLSSAPTAISELVNSMNPIDPEKSRVRYDALFLETVSMVSHLFKRACFHAVDYAIAKLKYLLSNKERLSDGRILVTDADVPHFGNFSGTNVHFVVFPVIDHLTGDEHYVIRPIYETTSKFYKTAFPEHLLGLDREAIEEQSVRGISFIHHGGFMARADNRESAIAFCQSILT